MLKEAKSYTAVEDIVNQISQLIISGKYKARDRIPGEIELMEMFKVGRSSIREAKKILSTKGLVESYPGKGTFVKEVSMNEIVNGDALKLLLSDQIQDLYEMRKIIEVPMMKLAIQRATEKDIEKVRESLNDMKNAMSNQEEWTRVGIEFHMRISEASHNQVIIKMYNIIASMLHEYQTPFYKENKNLDEEFKIHEEIYKCILERNESIVEEVMDRHFNYVGEVTNETLK